MSDYQKFLEFRDLLKKLKFIDRDKLEHGNIIRIGDHNAWGEFRRNPYKYIIQAPDDMAYKIWQIIT